MSIKELANRQSMYDVEFDEIASSVVGMEIFGISLDGHSIEEIGDNECIGNDLDIEVVVFELRDVESGEIYRMSMYHDQDCCEYVRLVDASGSWAGLNGKRIVRFTENISENGVDGETCGDDSCTWTFYDILADNGEFVTMRWLGESNGYYSESVDLRICEMGNSN